VTDQLGSVLQSRRAAAEPKEDEMSVTMVRQKVKDESVEEGEAAVRDLFATFDRVGLEGVRYASTRVVDSSTFVILFELEEGIEDPRLAIPEYRRFLEQLKRLGGRTAGDRAARCRRLVQPVRNPARGIRRAIGRTIWATARTSEPAFLERVAGPLCHCAAQIRRDRSRQCSRAASMPRNEYPRRRYW
jgi:hypothetical protein